MRKAIIIILIFALCFTACSQNKKEGKNKKTKQRQFLLDDLLLENEDMASLYASQLIGEGTNCLYQSCMTSPGYSFSELANSFDLCKEHLYWSEETAWQAFGFRQKLVEARAEAKAQSGALAGNEEAILGESIKADMDSLLKEGVQLQASQRDFFLASLVYLAAAITREVQLVKNIQAYISRAKNLSPLDAIMEARFLPKAVTMATNLPVMIASQTITLKTYLDFARTNNIKIPTNVSDMLP